MAQKVARFLGTNNVDNAARVCHAPSTAALKQAVGAIATTISYGDLMETDLVVLWGANVANAQPVMMKYLYLARREGTQVAVVNPHREPGLEKLLGAVQRRERPARHPHERRLLPGQHRRRRGLRHRAC